MRQKKKARGNYRQSEEKEVAWCGASDAEPESGPLSLSSGVSYSVILTKSLNFK